jgi:hypothetical protein
MILFQPEPIEAMRARFPEAIKDTMNGADDERSLDSAHWFDFDDGYRLLICRHRLADGDEVISVRGGIVVGEPVPLTLVICRVGINFADLTDLGFGQAILTDVDDGIVTMVFKTVYDPRHDKLIEVGDKSHDRWTKLPRAPWLPIAQRDPASKDAC